MSNLSPSSPAIVAESIAPVPLRVEIPPLPLHWMDDSSPSRLATTTLRGGDGSPGPILADADAPRTPIRPVLSPRPPPGAPVRLSRPPHTVEEESEHPLARLLREDPEHPLLCPRHEHIPRGGLGPSMNASGVMGGFYGAPAGSGCRHCKRDAEEHALVGEMCEALAAAEETPNRYNLGRLRMTLTTYDEFAGPYGGRYERGLIEKAIPELERAVAEAESVHHCGNPKCKWDCGVLDCGCIDLCRGRCGLGSERRQDRDRGGW